MQRESERFKVTFRPYYSLSHSIYAFEQFFWGGGEFLASYRGRLTPTGAEGGGAFVLTI